MERIAISPRLHWRETVESQGLTFHTLGGEPYWHESAYYRLASPEVDALEAAANELHQLSIKAAEQVIKRHWWARLGIPEAAVPVILKSWERDDFSLYGRFDFAYAPQAGPPKLLEYNADTPTALVEAAVVQWYWMQDQFKSADQFNSLHERLIRAWQQFGENGLKRVHLASIQEHLEDAQTVYYLEDTCLQAGLEPKRIFMEDVGWDPKQRAFVDGNEEVIGALFKLYPWEWMWQEEFGQYLADEPWQLIEPAWKMLLSNKGLLPILWELYPEHPNLLPAFFAAEKPTHWDSYVKKPLLGREGANITVSIRGQTAWETAGDYGAEGFVVQALAPASVFEGYHPVFGVWVVNHEAAGLGIREDRNLVTGNTSLFTPHIF